VLLDLAVLYCWTRFRQLDRWAAHLLLPYGAWLGFATALNAAIWWLNQAGQ
jgi:tryptophan-rich sensory protein